MGKDAAAGPDESKRHTKRGRQRAVLPFFAASVPHLTGVGNDGQAALFHRFLHPVGGFGSHLLGAVGGFLGTFLHGMTGLLGAKYYVANLLGGSAAALQYLLPVIIFLVAVFLAFATGTSWGTFSILIPIVCHAFPQGEMLVVSIAACLSGAVCGDHCSPISDTTIMASAGAHCSHVNHVSTQLPYAITAASCSAACYVITGLTQMFLGSSASLWTSLILLGVAIVLELVVLNILRVKLGKKTKA